MHRRVKVTIRFNQKIRLYDERKDDPEFDGIYLLATCLDCNYRFFVIDDTDVQKIVLSNVVKIAKQLGLKYCANHVQNKNNASNSSDSRVEK